MHFLRASACSTPREALHSNAVVMLHAGRRSVAEKSPQFLSSRPHYRSRCPRHASHMNGFRNLSSIRRRVYNGHQAEPHRNEA